MRAERKHDRELKSDEVAIVCIDLENVISLPKSNVGNFFIKENLVNIISLVTVHLTKNPTVFYGMRVWQIMVVMI